VYPAVVLLLGRRTEDSGQKTVSRGQGGANVAVLFSAHNEEAVILKRLENLAALDYPADRLHVFVGVDGGRDRTAEIALEWAKSHPNVHVVVSATNHGKTAMLKLLKNQLSSCLVAELLSKSSENDLSSATQQLDNTATRLLLAFTDANTFFAPDALRHLVAPFSDPKVGGVCGRLIFMDDAGAETRENLYWRVETLLKTAESRLDSCLGANGAIYAIRSELFWDEIPDSTIIDDFVIGMKVRERGLKMVYESQAIAREQTPALIADEWRRRVRIGAGAFQALSLCRACLAPRYGRFALFFWSHKILRWFTPHLMVLLAVAATMTLVYGTGRSVTGAGVILAAGALFLSLAVIGRLMGPSSRLKAFEYFLSMQAALFAGFLKYCRGGLKGTWERTERGE
jgi:cellulose synthase/poly-beta-1,6-N-acetylglucosamine synthase-like glycosyltransferase